jgi:SAM-dependent methyltransferase
LDLGCGSGRVTLPLARQGNDVLALDPSEGMLRLLRHKLADEGAAVQRRVRLLCADLRRFTVRRRFALVIMAYHNFQRLLTDAEQLDCLRCVAGHLALGGRLLVEVSKAFIPLPEMREPEVCWRQELPARDWVVLQRDAPRHDPARRVTTWEAVYDIHGWDRRLQGGRVVEALRHVEPGEMRALLAEAGLSVLEEMRGFERGSPAGRTVFTAGRPYP